MWFASDFDLSFTDLMFMGRWKYIIIRPTYVFWNICGIPDEHEKIVEKHHLLMGWTAAMNRVDQKSDIFCSSSVSKKLQMFFKNLDYENVYKIEFPFIHSAKLTNSVNLLLHV